MDLTLDHSAYKIVKGSANFIKELFGKLGFKAVYEKVGKEGKAVWLWDKEKDFVFQFDEIDMQPISEDKKIAAHIAFISERPKKAVSDLKKWLESKGEKVVTGAWSEKELYLDCPEVFVDFVIEIMHTSIVGK